MRSSRSGKLPAAPLARGECAEHILFYAKAFVSSRFYVFYDYKYFLKQEKVRKQKKNRVKQR